MSLLEAAKALDEKLSEIEPYDSVGILAWTKKEREALRDAMKKMSGAVTLREAAQNLSDLRNWKEVPTDSDSQDTGWICDKERLDWLADNLVIEGFVRVNFDIYELATANAVARNVDPEDVNDKDQRLAMRQLIDLAREGPTSNLHKEAK